MTHPAMKMAQRRWRFCRRCGVKIYRGRQASGQLLWVGLDGKVH